MVSPEFEGIVLFFRIVYLLFTVVCAGIISWMLYRKEQNPWIWYFVFPAICFVPTSIFQISYNSLTVYLLMLAAVILITSEAGKTEWVRYLCLGILMGIGCINYPTLAALAVGLTVWIGIKNKNGYWKSKTVFYIVGGSMTALVFFWWIFSDGDMTLFVQALKGMFTSPHEKTKGTIDGQYLLQTFFEPLKEFFLSGFGICSLIYLAVQFVFDVCLHRRFWNWVFLCLFLMMNAWSNKGTYGYVVLGILIAYSYLLLTDRRLWRQSKELLGILLGYILTYSFTSDNRNVMAAFEVAGPLICLCAGVILWEAAKEKHVAQPIFPMSQQDVEKLVNGRYEIPAGSDVSVVIKDSTGKVVTGIDKSHVTHYTVEVVVKDEHGNSTTIHLRYQLYDDGSTPPSPGSSGDKGNPKTGA